MLFAPSFLGNASPKTLHDVRNHFASARFPGATSLQCCISWESLDRYAHFPSGTLYAPASSWVLTVPPRDVPQYPLRAQISDGRC